MLCGFLETLPPKVKLLKLVRYTASVGGYDHTARPWYAAAVKTGRAAANASMSEKKCANEGESCICTGSVKYGAQGKWSSYKPSTSSIRCVNSVFGDPYPGVGKACYCNQGLAKGGQYLTNILKPVHLTEPYLGSATGVWMITLSKALFNPAVCGSQGFVECGAASAQREWGVVARPSPFCTMITTCYPDRVTTGPRFVPGLPHVVALSQGVDMQISELMLAVGRIRVRQTGRRKAARP